MLYKNAVLSESGVSHWGSQAVLLGEFEGSMEDVTLRYKRIVAQLGALGTEDARYRTVTGENINATVATADHTFLFPPQEDVVLRSMTDDGAATYDGEIKNTLEHKRAAIDGSNIDSELGVILDKNAEPPRVSVYELYRTKKYENTPISKQYEIVVDELELAIASLTSK